MLNYASQHRQRARPPHALRAKRMLIPFDDGKDVERDVERDHC